MWEMSIYHFCEKYSKGIYVRNKKYFIDINSSKMLEKILKEDMNEFKLVEFAPDEVPT